MTPLTVDILTPSKVQALGIPVMSLLIPAASGQTNILPGHTPMVFQMGTGAMVLFGGPDDPDRFFSVSTGLCRTDGKRAIILAHVCEEDKEVNLQRAQQALRNAEEKLNSHTLDDQEYEKFLRKRERARLRIQLATSSGEEPTGLLR